MAASTKSKSVVALVGSPGSGKTTVAQHFEAQGYTFFSISEVRRTAGLTLGVDPNNFEAMRKFTEDFYSMHGRGIFANFALQNIEARRSTKVVLEGLRYEESITVTREFCRLRNWQSFCLGLSVPAEVAADRIEQRGRKRDPQSPTAIGQYAAVAGRHADDALQHCDAVIENDSTIETLLAKADAELKSAWSS